MPSRDGIGEDDEAHRAGTPTQAWAGEEVDRDRDAAEASGLPFSDPFHLAQGMLARFDGARTLAMVRGEASHIARDRNGASRSIHCEHVSLLSRNLLARRVYMQEHAGQHSFAAPDRLLGKERQSCEVKGTTTSTALPIKFGTHAHTGTAWARTAHTGRRNVERYWRSSQGGPF